MAQEPAPPRSEAASGSRADALGLTLGFGSVGAVCGLLIAILVWSMAAGWGDSGGGVALLELGAGFAAVGATIGAAAALAWHRRRDGS